MAEMNRINAVSVLEEAYRTIRKTIVLNYFEPLSKAVLFEGESSEFNRLLKRYDHPIIIDPSLYDFFTVYLIHEDAIYSLFYKVTDALRCWDHDRENRVIAGRRRDIKGKEVVEILAISPNQAASNELRYLPR